MVVFEENNGIFAEKTELPFKGQEGQLETLLVSNPGIFPSNQIAEATTWIPLARQVSIKNHGALDILATDNEGNIYIVECKIKGNQSMKTIRGQITDYVAGLWMQRGSWEDFQKLIKDKSDGKKDLKTILRDNEIEEVEDIISNIKQSFDDGKYFLVYAVDQITPGLRDVIDWHNKQVDVSHTYPSFALEVKRYHSETNSGLIVTQNFPFNLSEIKRKKEGIEQRNLNKKSDWEKIFAETNIPAEQKNKIKEFVKDIESLISDDGGDIGYGTGKNMPRMLPKFNMTILRSPIGIKANGVLKLQFGLVRGEYPDESKEFKDKIFAIPELKKEVLKNKSKGEPAVAVEKWLPYKDKILEIIKEVFVKQTN